MRGHLLDHCSCCSPMSVPRQVYGNQHTNANLCGQFLVFSPKHVQRTVLNDFTPTLASCSSCRVQPHPQQSQFAIDPSSLHCACLPTMLSGAGASSNISILLPLEPGHTKITLIPSKV